MTLKRRVKEFLWGAMPFYYYYTFYVIGKNLEQSYGVPMSTPEPLSDSMQVIGKSTEQIFNKLKVQAKEDP